LATDFKHLLTMLHFKAKLICISQACEPNKTVIKSLWGHKTMEGWSIQFF